MHKYDVIIIGAGSVGVAGTATVRATGVVDKLKAEGVTVFDHWPVTGPSTTRA